MDRINEESDSYKLLIIRENIDDSVYQCCRDLQALLGMKHLNTWKLAGDLAKLIDDAIKHKSKSGELENLLDLINVACKLNLIDLLKLFIDDARIDMLSNPTDLFDLIMLTDEGTRSDTANIILRRLQKLRPNLNKIDLSWHKLQKVPWSVLLFNNLVELDLSFNGLELIPEDIFPKSLKKLNLSDNNLKVLPESIYELDNLDELNLDSNFLENIHEDIGKLKMLEDLNLSSNMLVRLPENICDLKNLKELGVVRNKLKNLPANFGELRELRNVYLTFNNLSEIPKSVGKLSKLREFYVIGNEINSIPEELAHLKHVIYYEQIYHVNNDMNNLEESVSLTLGMNYGRLTEFSEYKSPKYKRKRGSKSKRRRRNRKHMKRKTRHSRR